MNEQARGQIIHKTLIGLVYYASLVFADLVVDGALGRDATLAAVGMLIPVAATLLWGQRLRPRATAGWWILGLLAMVGLVAVGQVLMAAGLAAGIFLVHDMQLTPSVMLTGGIVAGLLQPGYDWLNAGENQAWFLTTCVLLAVVAAILERDRLALRDAQPVHLAWTAVRVAFLGLWSVLVVANRETLEAGRIFAWFGADPTGFEGQMLLLAILLTAVVAAAFLFRTRKPPQDQAPR